MKEDKDKNQKEILDKENKEDKKVKKEIEKHKENETKKQKEDKKLIEKNNKCMDEVTQKMDDTAEREELYEVFKRKSLWTKFKESFFINEDEVTPEDRKFDKWCLKGLVCGLLMALIFSKSLLIHTWFIPLENIGQVKNKLNEINFFVNKYFLYEKDLDNIKDMIALGMMAGLDDKYANYYTKEDVKKLQETVVGEYYGIGVVVIENLSEGNLIVTKIYEGSPAEGKGLEVGDQIVKVDGKEIKGMALEDAVALVKGKVGTNVVLSVIKPDARTMDIEVTRMKVEVPETTGKMLDDGIGYVNIDSFEGKAYRQFLDLQTKFEKQGIKGLIIDLRNNTGGNLTVLKSLSSIFIDNKLITYFEHKNGKRDEYYAAKGSWDIPLVILVNGYSASASEAFAGAMQDYERATLIGTKTFGKGVVQEIYNMSDGSAIKFTVAKYYTPKGRNFDGEGITPDIEIKNNELDKNDKTDYQLNKAIEVLKEKMN